MDINSTVSFGRNRQVEGQRRLASQLLKLAAKEQDREKILIAVRRPSIETLFQDRSFDVGITRYDNLKLKKSWKEFLYEQRKITRKLNALTGEMTRNLDLFLEGIDSKSAALGTRYIKQQLKKVDRTYRRALFFGLFKELLDSWYTDGRSPFKNDTEHFKHVIRHVNPNKYLRRKPLKSSSPIFTDPIIEVYGLIRPSMKSNNKAYKAVARLFWYNYPNIFTGDFDDKEELRKISDKVRRHIEKST